MRFLRRPVAALAIAVLALVGCSTGGSSSAAATVNGDEISRSLIEDAVTEITDRAGTTDGADAEARAEVVAPLQRQLLGLVIQARIIEQIADDRDIEVDEQEIEEQLEDEVETAGGDDEFAADLAELQLTLEVYRDVLLPAQKRVAALQEALASDLPDTEVRTARHILVEEQDEAQDLVDQLEDGADFAELAEEHSTDGSAAQGGDLGSQPRGSYVDPFEEAVWESELNEIVGPVETQFGFHVIEVTDESTLTADELDPAAQSQAVDAELNQLLETAFAEADVEVDEAFGAWDSELGQVTEIPPVGSDPSTESGSGTEPESGTESEPESD